MTSRFASRSEVAAKVDWEGGLEDALDYGLRIEHMPEGDTELGLAWWLMEVRWKGYAMAMEAVRKLLEQPVQEAASWPTPA